MNNPVINTYGDQTWYNTEGQIHRVGGPAVIWNDEPATCFWWVNGKHHRTDGPAIIWHDRIQEWWVNGEPIFNNKEFQEAASLTDEEMTAIILKYGNVE